MLILAAVSIATLTGENGILSRATESKIKTEKANEDELRKLTQVEAATHLKKYEYIDANGEKLTIPAQCAVSQVKGENTLEDGLVIIDANGNEWVWVEVPKSVTKDATTDEEIKNALISYATDYRKTNYSDTWYEGCGLEPQEYANKYSDMLQNIKANGGFYIGRYEVGSFDNPVTTNDTTRKAVIQKGAYPYNWVTVSQAKELAKSLAVEEGMTSTLMFGIQWDLVLKNLEVNAKWGETIDASYNLITDSSDWGNYENIEFDITSGNYSENNGTSFTKVDGIYTKPVNCKILLTTGTSKRNNKMNIYDLAGNVFEFTLENFNNQSVNRGGSYYRGGFVYPASFRGGYNAFDSGISYAFRPALY